MGVSCSVCSKLHVSGFPICADCAMYEFLVLRKPMESCESVVCSVCRQTHHEGYYFVCPGCNDIYRSPPDLFGFEDFEEAPCDHQDFCLCQPPPLECATCENIFCICGLPQGRVTFEDTPSPWASKSCPRHIIRGSRKGQPCGKQPFRFGLCHRHYTKKYSMLPKRRR